MLVKTAIRTLIVAALVIAPFAVTSPYYLHLLVTIAIFAIVALGLDIVFGYTGEVSIGHAALFGIGAYTAGCLVMHFDLGFWPSIVLGPIVAAAFGGLLALPALRVTGPYLAMVTLAFGTIVQILINETVDLTNGPLGIKLNTPFFLDLRDYGDTWSILDMSLKRMRDVEYFYVTGIALLLAVLVINRITASRFGRAFEALRDAPIACDCMAVSVYRHKVMAFIISAAFAGFGGVLFAFSEQYIAPNTFSFDLSVQFLLAVTMGGRKSRLGPILGATIVVFLPNILADIALFRIVVGVIAAIALCVGLYAVLRRRDLLPKLAPPVALCILFFVLALTMRSITDFRLSIFGLMILFVVYFLPDGIVGAAKILLRQITPAFRKRHASTQAEGEASHAITVTTDAVSADALLEVRTAVMQFGGLRALDKVDLAVTAGTIHGLIGPNGSGKSTMMNLLSGIYTPTSGEILFEGRSIAGLGSSQIAGRGIARTFQNVQLFGELTLLENVLVGLHHSYKSTLLDVVLRLPRAIREERAARQRAADILSFVGLRDRADEEARNLPYGKQRLLEIGRALALDPKLLLLDEPAAGLTAPDIADLIAIIKAIRARGISVILIEHHMDVVMGLCDVITVLDFGQKIAEGQAAAVQANPRVVEAYLGGAVAA
ncbi:ATP-binding cassette domain-containing protein [Beijerinckia sp. L45]|uniref:branched-chain amino acid ABC transporter ATP-binding protein/permease n=1 Tax=Beijerinckia sp. L45 TaxID=1641855 RepID=UPI00131A73DB|nr:branched-chain amino acid ABC transporter ATP-binding protein/permease [Beijerinckia sp. L45]